MTKTVYDKLKKQNGEKFARVLRPVLDLPDIIDIVKYAGKTENDANNLLSYLYSLRTFTAKTADTKDPFELLYRAGYTTVIYADTLEKQNSIKNYFRFGEELCTFKDVYRFEDYYIIHAIKYNADVIKPAERPKRQDEYGTSVISIQILKTGGRISIKNRYNHTVEYPDNTFDNNPDNIIPGLTPALKDYFNVDWGVTNVSLPSNFTQIGKQLIKYNYEVNNVYFGENFYEAHGEIHEINKDNQKMLDYFIWDNKEKKLLNPSGIADGFVDAFNTEINGKKITVNANSILADNVEIVRIQDGKIISVNMPSVTMIGDNFLHCNACIKSVTLPNVKNIGDAFICSNIGLTELNLPNLECVGDRFIIINKKLENLDLPNLKRVGNCFMSSCGVKNLNLPELTYTGSSFMDYNERLMKLNLPNLKSVGNGFMLRNALVDIKLPKLETIGNNFMSYSNFYDVKLPCVNSIGDGFMEWANVRIVNMPNVKYIGNNFMKNNNDLTEINMPNVCKIGCYFMHHNKELTKLSLENLENVGNNFMEKNKNLTEINMPNVKYVGNRFLSDNKCVKKIMTPQLETVGDDFMYFNENIEKLDMPALKCVGKWFLRSNNKLKVINLPNLESVNDGFLGFNNSLKKINFPKLKHVGDKFMFCNNAVEICLMALIRFGKSFFEQNICLEKLDVPNLKEFDGDGFLVKHNEREHIINSIKKHIRTRLHNNAIKRYRKFRSIKGR